MLAGAELTDLRVRLFGSAISAASNEQLKDLTMYSDKPFRSDPDGSLPCGYCQANEPMCELAAERLDPAGEDGTILVKGGMICRRCLAVQLPLLREHLREIHWIELVSMEWQPTSIVMTTESELEAVLIALSKEALP
mgnify:FL=1